MTSCNCKCKNGCTLLVFVVSLLIGVITGFLRYSAAVTITSAFLWALFGIGVGFLAIGVATGCDTSCCSACDGGWASPLKTLVYGALGTVLFSVILLGGSFAVTSVVGAIFAGLALFSFALLLGSAACLVGSKCDE